MADKLMPVAGVEVTAAGAAECYRGLLAGWVIDEVDRDLGPRIEATGVRVAVTDTIMRDDAVAEARAADGVGSAAVSVELIPVEGLPEIRPGDDLVALLGPRLEELGVRDGDVVAVTQKIVSKAEGRVVPDEGDGRSSWIERETRRVVARRGDLVIAETRHGFVCANAGVDASNVAEGFVTLLPEDPDGSAERLRSGLEERLGVAIAVVITDTFGRAWREGW